MGFRRDEIKSQAQARDIAMSLLYRLLEDENKSASISTLYDRYCGSAESRELVEEVMDAVVGDRRCPIEWQQCTNEVVKVTDSLGVREYCGLIEDNEEDLLPEDE